MLRKWDFFHCCCGNHCNMHLALCWRALFYLLLSDTMAFTFHIHFCWGICRSFSHSRYSCYSYGYSRWFLWYTGRLSFDLVGRKMLDTEHWEMGYELYIVGEVLTICIYLIVLVLQCFIFFVALSLLRGSFLILFLFCFPIPFLSFFFLFFFVSFNNQSHQFTRIDSWTHYEFRFCKAISNRYTIVIFIGIQLLLNFKIWILFRFTMEPCCVFILQFRESIWLLGSLSLKQY